jgi:tight adherence protein C
MLTICVDAGLGFDAALQKVSDKWENPLAQEFRMATLEMNMGLSREEALRHIIERTDVPEVSSFIAVLIQAYKLGVSIGHVLHQQSRQLRLRRRQWAEEEAHKAPIKMLIPLALFIFPAIFVVIIGPAIPKFITQFPMH